MSCRTTNEEGLSVPASMTLRGSGGDGPAAYSLRAWAVNESTLLSRIGEEGADEVDDEKGM